MNETREIVPRPTEVLQQELSETLVCDTLISEVLETASETAPERPLEKTGRELGMAGCHGGIASLATAPNGAQPIATTNGTLMKSAGSSRSAASQRPPGVVFPGLLDTICSLLSIVVVAVFVLTFIVQPFRIPSESMERTLLVGDFLLVNKAVYAPAGLWSHALPYRPIERGDIVVFHFPLDPTDHVVKRVIGMPGDRVRLNHARVFVNGKAVDEPYVVYEASYPDSFRDNFPATLYTDPGVDTHWWIQMRKEVKDGELVVPPEMYFVLGDNRNHSRDSRYWGFVPRANIVGRPFVVYFSLWQPSTTDVRPLPDDRLGNDNDKWNSVSSFARWDRMFRVVR